MWPIRTCALILLPAVLAALVGPFTDSARSAALPVGSGRVDVTLALRPQHPRLLARLAAASSGMRPLAPALVRALFYPQSAQVARLRAAMHGAGLRFQRRHALSITFSGAPAAVRRAFGVTLQPARRTDGSLALRPSAAPRLPSQLAGLVRDVEGIDTRQRLRPASSGPATAAAAPACSGARDSGGYLPSQLASGAGYGHGSLIAGGYNGAGERIALVEFSNYRRADIDAYQRCFGLSVPVDDVVVGRGTGSRSGSDEVELDIETAVSAAPGLDRLLVYIAPPAGTISAVVNQIVAEAPATGVRVISDSWGLCEPALSPARVAGTNDALQLAAVSGITFLAASGDSGSFDCTGFPVLAVDDPAAQPFATGVGGSDLRLGTHGAAHEVVWDDRFGAGGGGLSRFWPRPSWQTGPGVLNPFSDGSRQLPDLSLHSSPHPRGYAVYCTTAVCRGRGWASMGGTSAAAPLMAGIVADINSYSRAHGGQRLGFANPFLYDRLATAQGDYRDIVDGDNDPDGRGRYPATQGYDLATGAGAPRAPRLAADLAVYEPSRPAPAATHLTAAPARDLVIRYGRRVHLRGRLTAAAGAPIGGVHMYVQGSDLLGVREWRLTTAADGGWSLVLGRQLVRRTRWRAVYLGSQHRSPSVAPAHTIYVIPPLSAALRLHQVAPGQRLRFTGRTLPALGGRRWRRGAAWRRPLAQDRPGRGHRERQLCAGAGVLAAGPLSASLALSGGRRGQWLSARSPVRWLRVG